MIQNKITSGKALFHFTTKYLFAKKTTVVKVLLFLIIASLCNITAVMGTGYAVELVGYAAGQDASIPKLFGFWEIDISGIEPSVALSIVCGSLMGTYVIMGISNAASGMLLATKSEEACHRLRQEIIGKLHTLEVNYFDSHSSGDLMNRTTTDVDNILMFFQMSVSQIITSIFTIISMLTGMFLTSSYLALIVLIFFPVLVSITAAAIKKTTPLFTTQLNQLGILNGYAEEMISGQLVVGIYQQEKNVSKKFREINEKVNTAARKATIISNLVGPSIVFITNITLLLVSVLAIVFVSTGVGLGGLNVVAKGNFTTAIATIASFTLFLRRYNQPFFDVLENAVSIQKANVSSERIAEVLNANDEKLDRETEYLPLEIKGHVEIKNLTFGYNKEKNVLRNINIDAPPQTMTAVVGPTGSGKTTLINLLTKFYNVEHGDILIDGHSIQTLEKTKYRDHVSIVLQDPFLFSISIKDNIKYAKTDATDQEIIEACKLAHVHEYIMSLENGYDTVLVDGGEDMSQGQKQLLSIARAIISPSKILILDEATSSIDTKTERDIQNAIANVTKIKTSFVIAHRLSTIVDAYQIAVIKLGDLVEIGSHKDLLALNGEYANLYNSQFSENHDDE